ncbi:hypothetical protein [Paractinoplanes durhamensis]|uniref:Discoidin domain-containing protein n=1 Tax=Paractinoplanes durhamensis TaxID=113563 RepID=A0ABQ3Z3F8_9ACTN|nr:hypothetical protein [Actinoplanes durhamensis]GIE04352.1 hypothetical protein Adu01nite_57020 [Actinoplanes durhamensis]
MLNASSRGSRWTLAIAAAGSAVLLTATVLFLRHEMGADPVTPAVSLPGPWEPPSAVPATIAPAPSKRVSTAQTSATPTTKTPPAPTTTRPTQAATLGPNLSIGAQSDGTSKAEGTSFGNVRDGDRTTFWSPEGETGEISIKRDTPFTVARVIIREAAGGGTIQSWRLRDHDTGTVLATGTTARNITFAPATIRKIDFDILAATGTPRVAEFETYGS